MQILCIKNMMIWLQHWNILTSCWQGRNRETGLHAGDRDLNPDGDLSPIAVLRQDLLTLTWNHNIVACSGGLCHLAAEMRNSSAQFTPNTQTLTSNTFGIVRITKGNRGLQSQKPSHQSCNQERESHVQQIKNARVGGPDQSRGIKPERWLGGRARRKWEREKLYLSKDRGQQAWRGLTSWWTEDFMVFVNQEVLQPMPKLLYSWSPSF